MQQPCFVIFIFCRSRPFLSVPIASPINDRDWETCLPVCSQYQNDITCIFSVNKTWNTCNCEKYTSAKIDRKTSQKARQFLSNADLVCFWDHFEDCQLDFLAMTNLTHHALLKQTKLMPGPSTRKMLARTDEMWRQLVCAIKLNRPMSSISNSTSGPSRNSKTKVDSSGGKRGKDETWCCVYNRK